MAEACFQLKGTTVTTLVLDLYNYHPELFARQLRDKVNSAPRLFTGSSLYVNLTACPTLGSEELDQLIARCRELDLQPFACKGASAELLPTLRQLGLLLLPATRGRDLPAAAQTAPPTPASVSKVIHRPVRSGQQVYAKGGDLILLAPVNEGAEVIADGNIHVYSTLRGRALAGVNDSPGARIFCQQLEAELVSIAGHFVLNDTLRENCWKQAAHIYLENESLQITAL